MLLCLYNFKQCRPRFNTYLIVLILSFPTRFVQNKSQYHKNVTKCDYQRVPCTLRGIHEILFYLSVVVLASHARSPWFLISVSYLNPPFIFFVFKLQSTCLFMNPDRFKDIVSSIIGRRWIWTQTAV